MTGDERKEIISAVICHVDDPDSSRLRIYSYGEVSEGRGGNSALYCWKSVVIQLWTCDPYREVCIDGLGEITSVSVLKPVPLDKPDRISLSKGNWDIPLIDRELVKWARSKADEILRAVEVYGGEDR